MGGSTTGPIFLQDQSRQALKASDEDRIIGIFRKKEQAGIASLCKFVTHNREVIFVEFVGCQAIVA